MSLNIEMCRNGIQTDFFNTLPDYNKSITKHFYNTAVSKDSEGKRTSLLRRIRIFSG